MSTKIGLLMRSLMQFTLSFWIIDIRTKWIPNMETHSVNMIKIRTETRRRINEVSWQQNYLFICLFMSRNHDRACLRITIVALRQWQKWRLQQSGSTFSILLCLLKGKLILGSETQEKSISSNLSTKFSPFLFLR